MKKLKDINWNQIYYLYEVARQQSMKQASKVVGVSAPSINEQIKRLEKMLGLKLFHRQNRKITLTNEGESLFHTAKEMFAMGTRFLDAVSPNSIGG